MITAAFVRIQNDTSNERVSPSRRLVLFRWSIDRYP